MLTQTEIYARMETFKATCGYGIAASARHDTHLSGAN